MSGEAIKLVVCGVCGVSWQSVCGVSVQRVRVCAQYEPRSHVEQVCKDLPDTNLHQESSGVHVLSVCVTVCVSLCV